MKRRSKLVGPAKNTSIASATAGPKRLNGSIMCLTARPTCGSQRPSGAETTRMAELEF